MTTVKVTRKWSIPEKIARGVNVKITFDKAPFTYKLKDYKNNREYSYRLSKEDGSPFNIFFANDINMLMSMTEPTISFCVDYDETFDINYEEWLPGIIPTEKITS